MSSVMCKTSLNQNQGPHLLQSEGLRCLVSQRNVPLHHSTTHSRQSNLFFAELENQWCLAGTHCFGRGPKAQVIAMDWKGLHPQVSNLHSSQAIYETKQLPPTTLWMLKLPIWVPLLRCKHTQTHDKPVSCTISVEEPSTEAVHKWFSWYHNPAKLVCNEIPLYRLEILPTTTVSNTNWHKECE